VEDVVFVQVGDAGGELEEEALTSEERKGSGMSSRMDLRSCSTNSRTMKMELEEC
jgi:hypothetical protein